MADMPNRNEMCACGHIASLHWADLGEGGGACEACACEAFVAVASLAAQLPPVQVTITPVLVGMDWGTTIPAVSQVTGREPLLHTHISDGLPVGHPMANDEVVCVGCIELVHAANNECMQAWVETGEGPFCLECFEDALESYGDDLALPADPAEAPREHPIAWGHRRAMRLHTAGKETA